MVVLTASTFEKRNSAAMPAPTPTKSAICSFVTFTYAFTTGTPAPGSLNAKNCLRPHSVFATTYMSARATAPASRPVLIVSIVPSVLDSLKARARRQTMQLCQQPAPGVKNLAAAREQHAVVSPLVNPGRDFRGFRLCSFSRVLFLLHFFLTSCPFQNFVNVQRFANISNIFLHVLNRVLDASQTTVPMHDAGNEQRN